MEHFFFYLLKKLQSVADLCIHATLGLVVEVVDKRVVLSSEEGTRTVWDMGDGR